MRHMEEYTRLTNDGCLMIVSRINLPFPKERIIQFYGESRSQRSHFMERAAGLGRTAHLRSWQIEGALPLTITYHFQVRERTTLSVFKVTSPSKIRAGGGLTLKEYVESVS